MIPHPLVYLVHRRLRNRLVSALKRIRQPKYMIGALILGAYIILVLFWITEDRTTISSKDLGDNLVLFGSLGILALAIGAWVSMRRVKGHPLGFEKAEVEMLFPLPVSRRALVLYRLLARQPRILLSVLVFALFINRSFRSGTLLAAFIVFSVFYLHTIGAAFAHATPLQAGLRRNLVAWLPFALIVSMTVLGLALAGIDPGALFSKEALNEIERIGSTGLLAIVLEPFRVLSTLLIGRPESNFYLPALGWGALILVGHLAWVFLQDVAFEEASLRGAEVRAARIEAFKKGNWGVWKGFGGSGLRGQPFRLAPIGPPVWAYVWKGILAAGRLFRPPVAFIGLLLSVGLGMILRTLVDGLGLDETGDCIALPVAAMCAWMIYFFILFGQSREGFGMIETMSVLKPLPAPGRAVFLGSLLAEVSTVMVIYSLLAGATAGYLIRWMAMNPLFGSLLFASALFAIGSLVALASGLRMAIVLWLPFTATIQVGPSHVGHNFLVFLTRLVGLFVLLIPPALIVAVVGVLVGEMRYASHLCLMAGGAVILLEVKILGELGGRLYDRFDPVLEA